MRRRDCAPFSVAATVPLRFRFPDLFLIFNPKFNLLKMNTRSVILLIICLGFGLFLPAQKRLSSANEEAIMQVLEYQQDQWNYGSLEGFMEGYWKSDSLKFVGSRGISYGWDQTLANYKKGYPDQDAMGQLTFKVLSLEAIGKKHALMMGKWSLDRGGKDDLEGHFTLIWKKFGKDWLIIADHSS